MATEQDHDRGDGVFVTAPIGGRNRFTCHESDRPVRSQIYDEGVALTLGDITDRLNNAEIRDEFAHLYSPYKPITEPFTRSEQDDIFNQMEKCLKQNKGVMRNRQFMACELENFYRMRATILHQRKVIEAGDTAILQLEAEITALENQA